MRYRYFEWDQELIDKLMSERNLMQLFNQLLVRTSGDVDKAMEIMEYLKEKGYIGKDVNLKDFQQKLQQDEIIQKSGPANKLTPKGEQWIRQESLEFIFRSLSDSGRGEHALKKEGGVGDVLPERRPFEFGDSSADIDFNESYKNALRRTGSIGANLEEKDLSVYERESATSAATVLLLDLSHSMILYGEDRITPAKQVALAMAQMIKTRFPKDSLEIVTFGDEAKRISLAELPYVSVGPYHTNTQEGLQVARELLLRQKTNNRQIFMITDGKPSVVRQRNGELYINSFGLDPFIVNRTLDEALICRKKNIVITTFMIASDSTLQLFIKRLTELNKGRAYFAPVNRLGSFIFRDFMSNRQRRAR